VRPRRLEGTTEGPHFDRTAFKVARIYVTLAADGRTANFKFTPDEQQFKCMMAPDAFAPIPNAWGRQGWTTATLSKLSAVELKNALERQRHSAQIGAGCHRPRNLLILAGVRGTISHFCCARSTRSPLAVGRNPDACCRQLFVGPATPGLFSVCDADLNALTRRRLPCYGFACLIHVLPR
jgi:hypothetical protein